MLRSPISILMLSSLLLTYCTKKEEPEPAIQLLKNTALEEGTSNPDGWLFNSGQDSYSMSWSNEQSYSPSKSLKITIEEPEVNHFSFWAQFISSNIPVNKNVVLNVKVKGSMEGEGISMAIRGDSTEIPEGDSEQFTSTQQSQLITGTFDWTDYKLTLDHVDENTKSLTVYLIMLPLTTGEVYFDDISLTIQD